MEIVRTSVYERALKRLSKLGASDADVLSMETAIALAPDRGDVIRGSGGLRKLRFGYGGKGKSGGGRTVYYVVRSERVILLFAYAKIDQDDVAPHVLRQLAALAKEME